MTSVTIQPTAASPSVQPNARSAPESSASVSAAPTAKTGQSYPNPSLRLDSQLGLVVIEFFDSSGAVARTIPSTQQLAAYQLWTETGNGSNPLSSNSAATKSAGAGASATSSPAPSAPGLSPAGQSAPEQSPLGQSALAQSQYASPRASQVPGIGAGAASPPPAIPAAGSTAISGAASHPSGSAGISVSGPGGGGSAASFSAVTAHDTGAALTI